VLEIRLFVLVHNIINQLTKIVLADLWVYEGVVKIADKRLLAVLLSFEATVTMSSSFSTDVFILVVFLKLVTCFCLFVLI
jgi:hypothetical protein